jgi:hypothetical protein
MRFLLITLTPIIFLLFSCKQNLSDEELKEIIADKNPIAWDIREWKEISRDGKEQWQIDPARHSDTGTNALCHSYQRGGDMFIMNYFKSGDSLFRQPQWNGDVSNVVEWNIENGKLIWLYSDTLSFIYCTVDSFSVGSKHRKIVYIRSNKKAVNRWKTIFR